MFLRYWNNPEATQEKFLGNWMLTGDMAVQDEDGYFWFQGRKDDVISSAGYRIGPTEIEDCLLRHPAVAMAAAVGIPDEVRGEVVKAYIVPRPGVRTDEALKRDVQNFVRSRLAAYLYPREIEFIAEMPLTTTGKIRRKDLRASHEQKRRELERS
jgi:acetyl-CoA synthetase